MFSLVTHLTFIRNLLAIFVVKRWKLHQIDVKNAFLNCDLQKEIYMNPPPSYYHSPNQVCKLRRALYGLKQALRAWFAKFSSIVSVFGFISSLHDSVLFIDTLIRVFPSFLDEVRNILLLLALASNLNIVLLLMPLRSYFGYADYFKI